jgi:hypothetical protein
MTNLSSLILGQEVAIACMGSWEMHYEFNYKVVKISAGGEKVTVEKKGLTDTITRTFNQDGDETGTGSSYRVARLETDIETIRTRIAEKEARKTACRAVQDVKSTATSIGLGKAALEAEVNRLEDLLNAAKALITALPN